MTRAHNSTLHPFAALIAVLLTAVACGKSGSTMSPLAPSASSPFPASAGGATITGSVQGGAGAMSVGITGSGLRVTVDGAGRFALQGAPIGTVELQFSAANLDARLRIDDVVERERIELQVKITGNLATLDARQRVLPDGHAEVEGVVASVDPPSRIVRVGSSVVRIPAEVEIHDGAAVTRLEDLREQDRILVRGVMKNDVVEASEVQVEDRQGVPEPPQNEVEFSGTVGALGGSCPSITFTAAGRTVKASGATAFLAGGCGDVRNGVKQIEGIFRQRGAYARFKELLARVGCLERWYGFEAESTERALKGWPQMAIGSASCFSSSSSASTPHSPLGCSAPWRPTPPSSASGATDSITSINASPPTWTPSGPPSA